MRTKSERGSRRIAALAVAGLFALAASLATLSRTAWADHQARAHHLHGDPYYFHTGLGVFFGSGAFDVEVGERAPPGYAYLDPYCDIPFASVSAYKDHLRWRSHHPLLVLVVL